MFRYGAVLVATSNRPPSELCMQGFRSVTATNFTNMIAAKCDPLRVAGGQDYRRAAPSGYDETTYVHARVCDACVRACVLACLHVMHACVCTAAWLVGWLWKSRHCDARSGRLWT